MLSLDLILVVIFTLIAGIAMPVGAAIACVERIRPLWLENELRHGVTAFGGGALLSAVAFTLVPDGVVNLNPLFASIYFFAGALFFMALDILLNRSKTPASQFVAMLYDFIPESIALGATFAVSKNHAYLLAVLITVQNLPEGFNAYRELNQSTTYHSSSIIKIFALTSMLGPILGVSGYLWLSDNPALVGATMLFASGGIIYCVFQDIAPQVKLEKHWAPPLGAVLGFVVGIIGYMLVQ